MLFKLTYRPSDINEVQTTVHSYMKAVDIRTVFEGIQSQQMFMKNISGLDYILIGVFADD